jgi:hypothetical protein
MDLVTVEMPATGVALARQTLEFLDATFGVCASRNRLQVIPD